MIEIYLLDNQKELLDEDTFVHSENPNWCEEMSRNNRGIAVIGVPDFPSCSGYLEDTRTGYCYLDHWIKKLLVKGEQ